MMRPGKGEAGGPGGGESFETEQEQTLSKDLR